MKFTQNGRTSGDETTPYIVTDYKAKTVREFIDEVITNTNEWGYIAVKKSGFGFITSPKCEYRYGKLLSELPTELLDLEIRKIESCGGWSRMDYLIWDSNNKDL